MLSSYLNQGYYGLSLALEQSFTPTWGIGNSWFTLSIYERLTGDYFLRGRTYPFKLESLGWDPYVNWHSMYTWLASDFSFLGTLLVVLLLAWLLASVWKSLLINHNIFALGLFILLMIMFMYLPANNQIFAFADTYITFWIFLIGWIFTEKIRIKMR